jgi:hypothetical protein
MYCGLLLLLLLPLLVIFLKASILTLSTTEASSSRDIV